MAAGAVVGSAAAISGDNCMFYACLVLMGINVTSFEVNGSQLAATDAFGHRKWSWHTGYAGGPQWVTPSSNQVHLIRSHGTGRSNEGWYYPAYVALDARTGREM